MIKMMLSFPRFGSFSIAAPRLSEIRRFTLRPDAAPSLDATQSNPEMLDSNVVTYYCVSTQYIEKI